MRPDLVIASFPPPIGRNPYQRLLYEQLAGEGVAVDPAPSLHLDWLWQNRSRVRVLHFHWPEEYYRHDSPGLVGVTLSWLRFGLFGLRLSAARLLGYRIVWTVHQINPHESSSRALDRAAASLLVRVSHALIVLGRATAEALARSGAGTKLHVIPHGSYAGVYPKGRSRGETRKALGIPGDALVALSFGQIRKYKDVDLLVRGFRRAAIPDGVLVVTGLPLDQAESRRLAAAAEGRRDLVLLLEFVPDEGVAELFDASDVAVSARGDGGTSGSLLLALTLGLPVVAAAAGSNEELTGHGCAAWYFTPGDATSLSEALRSAWADPELRAWKARCAAQLADRMSWAEIARETVRVLTGG